MPPKKTNDFVGADWWRYKYNLRTDKAREILELAKELGLKDLKSLMK